MCLHLLKLKIEYQKKKVSEPHQREPHIKDENMFVKKGRTKQQMTLPPVWVTQLDGFIPVQSQRAPRLLRI